MKYSRIEKMNRDGDSISKRLVISVDDSSVAPDTLPIPGLR